MDKLILKNMVFHAYHGHFKVEQEVGQKFEVDVELMADLKTAGRSDHLSDTIDIDRVYHIAEHVVVNDRRFNLIEALAEEIATRILAACPKAEEVVIRVRKDKAPVKGIVDYAEVEIHRCQLRR